MPNWPSAILFDFDGVIVFDESHALQNAGGGKSERGDQAPSQQGRAGLRLQHALPDARIVYVSATGALLSEYCVDFPDHERPYGSVRLPPSDDVLAKWMALTADEHRLIENANLHLAGRQLDPDAIRSDIAALSRWERERERRGDVGSLRAP